MRTIYRPVRLSALDHQLVPLPAHSINLPWQQASASQISPSLKHLAKDDAYDEACGCAQASTLGSHSRLSEAEAEQRPARHETSDQSGLLPACVSSLPHSPLHRPDPISEALAPPARPSARPHTRRDPSTFGTPSLAPWLRPSLGRTLVPRSSHELALQRRGPFKGTRSLPSIPA